MIVINVSKYRNNAIWVERDNIRVVALPLFRNHDVQNKTLGSKIGAGCIV